MNQQRRQQQAKIIRWARSLHRTTGVLLFVFFFVVGLTGLLLGWKKNSGGLIMAKTYEGSTPDLARWLSLDSLQKRAVAVFRDSVSTTLSTELDRIDVRHDKGTVKFVFVEGFWGLQLDGETGALLHIEKRRSDFIEKLHDGSLFDHYVGSSWFKLFYTTVMGLALILFTITGFWLWYGPKRMRKG